MEETMIHACAVEQAHGALVTVRQDRLGPEFPRSCLQARGDGIQRFTPGDPCEAALAFRAHTLLRIQQAVRMVLPFEILRDLAAQESARYGMIGIAAQSRGFTVFYLHQQGASV